MKTIASRSFKVGRVKDFNDPFEWRLSFTGIIDAGKSTAAEIAERLIQHQHEWMRIICFSDTAEESVLWAHYADHHHGMASEVPQFSSRSASSK